MKLIFVIALLIAVHLSSALEIPQEDFGADLLKLVPTLHDDCKVKSGTDEEHINKLKNGIFEDNEPIKQYFTCLFLKTQIISPDGVLNHKILKVLSPPEIKETTGPVMEECLKKVQHLPRLADKTYRLSECVYKTSPKNYIVY